LREGEERKTGGQHSLYPESTPPYSNSTEPPTYNTPEGDHEIKKGPISTPLFDMSK